MRFPFDQGEQLLDIIQIPAWFKSHGTGLRGVGAGWGRRLDRLKAGAQRLVNNPAKRGVKLPGQSPRTVQYIIVNCQGCSHADIITSKMLMSMHHYLIRAWRTAVFLAPACFCSAAELVLLLRKAVEAISYDKSGSRAFPRPTGEPSGVV